MQPNPLPMQPILKVSQRKDKKQDGKSPIIIQVYYKGKRTQFFTGVYVLETDFKDGKVINVSNKAYFNQLITNKRNEIEKNYLVQSMQGDIVLKEKEKVNRKNFFVVAQELYEGLRIRTKSGYADRCLNAIKDFKEFAGDQSFQSITNELLKNYETHLLKKKLARNTINRKFKRIKQVFIAEGEKWTYKPITYKQPQRDFLTLEEIKEIEGVNFEHPVKYYFLLSCYTGLRYSDLSRVKDKIVTNNGVKKIILSTTKTGSQVSIKLTPKLIEIIEKINEPLVSNVHANRILKDIVSFTEIKRKVTFHMARHSFAVNSATLGFPIEIVSRLLGHSSIRTTSIYYKITDVNLDNWMEKWS